ncbi:MAG: hypothetical protein LAT76_05355 [Schleiferiaceae bacterium]|nr:hypothetical protein [Schleiferiaceae bacterium]
MKKFFYTTSIFLFCWLSHLQLAAQLWDVQVLNVGRIDGRLERLVDLLQVTVNSTSPTPVQTHMLLEITGTNGITFTTAPIYLDYEIPVNPGFQVFTVRTIQSFYQGIDLEDLLLANVSPSVIDYITFERRLPPGQYQVCISVFDAENTMLRYGTNCTSITNNPKDPPVIMSPFEINQNGVLVNFNDPPNLMVNWIHPGVFGVDYTLEVKKLAGMKQLEAFNKQGRPQIYFEGLPDAIFPEKDINNLSYVITQDNNPFFDEGDILAVRVIAQSPVGEFVNEGKSNIVVLIMDGGNRLSGGGALESIPIDPQFARLVNLGNLMVNEDQNSITLNGFADMEFTFPGMLKPSLVRANVMNLEIQKGSVIAPQVLGGYISLDVQKTAFLPHTVSDLVQLKTVEWNYGQGFTVEADLQAPNGRAVAAEGTLQLFANGLSGWVEATAQHEQGFDILDDGAMKLVLHRMVAQFPQLSVMGEVDIQFAHNIPGVKTTIDLERKTFDIAVNQPFYFPVDLVEGSTFGKAIFKGMSGSVAGSFETKAIAFDLNLPVDLLLRLQNNNYCGMSASVGYASKAGFSVGSTTRSCSYPTGVIDLGFLQASFKNFAINKLQLPTESQGWDFELQLDLKLFSQLDPNWNLPEIQEVRITPSGIAFPYQKFLGQTLAALPDLNINNYKLHIDALEIQNFDFPAFSWSGNGIGPWELTFEGGVKAPAQFQGPACLQNTSISLTNGRIESVGRSQSRLVGNLSIAPGAPCAWQFDNGFEINVTQLAGAIEVTKAGQQFSVSMQTMLDGALVLGSGFDCGPQSSAMQFEGLEVSFAQGVSGRLDDLQSPCSVQIGPFSGAMNQTSLVFNVKNNQQEIRIQSGANLDLGSGRMAQGNFVFNVLEGKFETIDFELNGPFSWGIPKESPVVVFQIASANLSAEGLFIDGRNSLTAGGQSIQATFDNLLIDWDTYTVKSGQILLDNAFTFTAGIDEQLGALSYGITSLTDFNLPLDPGALLQLAGQVIIDSTGLRATGQALGKLKFGGYDLDSIQLTYTPDFAMRLDPLGVAQGEVSLFYQNQLIASLNRDGFFPNMLFFADEFLPEIIPLPTENIAYLRVKQNGNLLVDLIQEPNGTLLVQTKAAAPLELVIPALQQGQAQAPSIQVTLDNLRINPATGSYVSGRVIAQTAPGTWPGGNAEKWPISLESIVFETRTVDGAPIAALFFNGDLIVFDKVFSNAKVRLGVQSDGKLNGAFAFHGLSEALPLDGPGGKITVRADTLVGGFSIPLTDPEAAVYNVLIAGGLEILNADQSVAFQTSAAVEVTEVGASLKRFDGGTALSGQKLEVGPFSLSLEGINNMSLSYDRFTGFDYTIHLDIAMGFELSGRDTLFTFPLDGVELRKGGVFVIPTQDIHSTPQLPLDFPALRFGVFQVKPFAFRMNRLEFNWNTFNVAQLAQFVPKMDLELRFPGISQLANTSLTLQDFGIVDGILNGDIVPLDLSHNPLFLPIGTPDMGIEIHEFAGSLNQLANQVQNFDVRLRGKYRMPAFFSGSNPLCDTAMVTLALSRNGRVSGTVDNFLPCGKMEFGPVALGFTQSSLNLSYQGQTFSATLAGAAAARILKTNGDSITATGNLTVNLLTGEISNGEIVINDPFNWHYPTPDSLFSFTVNQARINSSGLVFNGQGSLQTGQSQIAVTFNNAGFSLANYRLTSGDISFGAAFALDIYTEAPVRWELSDPNVPFQSGGGSGVRMTMPSNLTLDNQGVLLDGQTTASLFINNENYGDLRLEYHQARIGFSPKIGFITGRADFIQEEPNQDPIRLAYFDSAGFHVDNIPNFLPVPDTLALPSRDIAYMILKNSNGELAVQTQIVDGTVRLNTRPNEPIELVLPALAFGQPVPKILATFSDVVINASYEIVSGEISVVMQNDPMEIIDFPIVITKLTYSKPESEAYRMRAEVKLNLPEALEALQLSIPAIELNANGFECITIASGQVFEQYQENMGVPLVAHSYNNGDFDINIHGADVTLCVQGDGPKARFSGLISTNLFKRNPTDQASQLHFLGSFANSNWTFAASAQHLPDFKVPIGEGQVILDSLGTQFSGSHFGVVVNGRLLLPELLGTTHVGFRGLQIGTNGVLLDQAAAQNMPPQSLSLFGQEDLLVVNQMGLSLTSNEQQRVLAAILGGEINAFSQTFSYSDLRIGSDGTFALGQGNVNLVQAPGKNIIGESLILKTLSIGVHENQARLHSILEVNLPEPFITNTNTVNVFVNGNGQVHVSDFNIEGTTPVAIGEVGQFQVTQVGFQMTDIFNPSANNLKLFASANITANSSLGGSASNTKIEIGKPNGIAEAGLIVSFGNPQPTWQNIAVNAGFSFSNDFFAFNLSAGNLGDACPSENGFVLSVNASAALTLDGFSGGIAMEGICIDKTGVTKLGTITNANLTVMDIISLEFGGIEWYNSPTTLTFTKASGDAENPDTTTETISVSKYLRIGKSSITMASFSGGFNEIMYYKTTTGGVSLNIDGVNLDLIGEDARLFASMRYMKEGNDFSIEVAGRASILGQGLAAMGYVRNENNQVGFGIFVKASVSVPILPGLVTLTEFGGGFFYRPKRSDIGTLLQVMDYGELANPNSRYNPELSTPLNIQFAVILNAGIGIVGQQMYAVTAQALVVLTEQSIDIDLRGTVLAQDKNIQVGAYFAVGWVDFEIQAGAFVNLDYSVVKAKGQVNFTANSEMWRLSASIEADVLEFFKFHAGVLLYNDGFLFDMGIRKNYDIWIIEVRTAFDLAVWWQKSEQVFGAYTEISFKASLFKGIGKVEGNLKGAFINKPNRTILYAGARVTASVLGIPKSVSAWAAVENKKFKGGRGSNSEYDRLVAEARGQLSDIESGIEALTNATPPPFDVAPLSDATLRSAGFKLVTTSLANQNAALNYNLSYYNAITTPAQASIIQDIRNVITSNTRPSYEPIEVARGRMTQRLSALPNELSDLYSRIDVITTAAIQWEVTAVEQLNGLEAMESPIVIQMTADSVYEGFEVDNSINSQNQVALGELERSVDQIEQAFRSVIDSIQANIARIDRALNESMIETIQNYNLFGLDPAIATGLGSNFQNFIQAGGFRPFHFQPLPGGGLIQPDLNLFSGGFGLGSGGQIITTPALGSGNVITPGLGTDFNNNLPGNMNGNFNMPPAGFNSGGFGPSAPEFFAVAPPNLVLGQRVVQEYQRTANDGAMILTEAHHVSEEYFAKATAYHLSFANWALQSRSHFFGSANVNAVNSLAENILVEYVRNNSNFNGTTYQQLLSRNANSPINLSEQNRKRLQEISSGNLYLIETLSGTSSSAAQTLATTEFTGLESNWTNHHYNQYFNGFRTRFAEFWRLTPVHGFDTARSYHTAMATEKVAQANEALQKTEQMQAEFADAIDFLYGVKASLMTTLYGAYELYEEWRDADSLNLIEDGPTLAEIAAARQNIGELLLAPSIDNIAVSETRFAFYNKVNISWNATHPSGHIAENAYAFAPQGQLMSKPTLAIGAFQSVERFIYATSYSDVGNKTYQIRIRSRAPSGNAISTVVSTSLYLTRDTAIHGGTHNRGVTRQNTKPTTPVVAFPFYPKARAKTGLDNFYWTKDDSKIVVRVSAADQANDIAQFEVKLGTTKGGNDLLDWTEIPGQRVSRMTLPNDTIMGSDSTWVVVTASGTPFTFIDPRNLSAGLFDALQSPNGRQEITIRNLVLDKAKRYYISVRAYNGAGVVSDEYEEAIPVRLDKSIPTTPQPAAQPVAMVAPPQHVSRVNYSTLTQAPKMTSANAITPVQPQVTLNWNSSQAESARILYYEIAPSTSEDATIAFADPSKVYRSTTRSLLLKGLPVNYFDSYYFHIRGVSAAGQTSEVYTIGPNTIVDPTRPVAPIVRGGVRNGNLGVWMRRPGMDPETQSFSRLSDFPFTYEYTFRPVNPADLVQQVDGRTITLTPPVASFSDNLVSKWWHATAKGELAVFSPSDFTGIDAPWHVLNKENALPNVPVRIEVAAVNAQGYKSTLSTTGPLIYDMTPPKVPNITATAPSGGSGSVTGTLSFVIANIGDPETGISRVEYRIVLNSSNGDGVPFTQAVQYTTPRTGTFQLSRSVTVNVNMSYRIEVRVTNGNGMMQMGSFVVPAGTIAFDPNLIINPNLLNQGALNGMHNF